MVEVLKSGGLLAYINLKMWASVFRPCLFFFGYDAFISVTMGKRVGW